MSQPSEPAAERRHVVRVGLGLLVPGVVLLVAGRPELIVYAVFGSFTGMYGRREAAAERLRHQFHGAGMLVTGVALGVTFSQREASTAALVVGVTLFATVGSLLTDRLRVHPGGPFFGIFAFGATATIGADLVDPFVAVGICVATAAWCLALGLSGLAPGEQPVGTSQEPPLGTLVHALRYAVAIAAAGAVGLALGLDHANWAMAAAAVPLAVVVGGEPLDLRAVLDRAAHRVAGTFAGLAVTAVVLLPEPRPAVLAVVVMALLFPTELFMSRHYGLALGFFTPLIMLMTELAAPSDPSSLLLARAVDTVVGVVVGVAAAALIPGRRPSGTAQERIAQWAE